MIKSPVTRDPRSSLSENQKLVYQLVRQRGSISRADLVRHLDITFPSVSRIVGELLELNMLQEGEKRHGGMGKPPIDLSVNPHHTHAFGVHLEGGKAEARLIDALGDTVASESFGTPRLPEQLSGMLEQAKVDSATLLGIGLSRAEGESAEETLLQGENFVAAPTIAASVRTERYFGKAQNLERFLYFDALHLELGGMVESTVLARAGTLEALLGVSGGSALQNKNLIPAALRGASALLEAETVFVAGLSDEDLGHLQKNLEGLKLTRASECSSNPALATATLPLYKAYSLA